ncbi:MAG: Lsr2 family protein [bacterium]|nr:Lsr2 family protein [bacterium]
MAKKVLVQLVDDIDGSEAVETVTFALDGIQYEIDVNEEHASELRSAFDPWVSQARRAGGRRTTRESSRGGRKAGGDSEASRIRAWAREQGIEVSERGRIPAELRERFAAASN